MPLIKYYFLITLIYIRIPVYATDCTAHFRQITRFNRPEYTVQSSYYPEHKVTHVEMSVSKKRVAEVVSEEKIFENTLYGSISNLRVNPNHKNMGVDTALVAYLLDVNRRKKMECTLVVVTKTDEQDFYQNLGFKPYGEENGHTTLRYQHAYRFLERGILGRIYRLLADK